jgi:sensor c-di-GMP phosphodiesterase-like protein
MHRYTPDLLARVRTDYVHEQQERYRTKIGNLEHEAETAERVRSIQIQKELKKLKAQLAECSDYEEKIHHLADQMIEIDLDDGVKVNYAKFQDVLAKIK